jgi:hypothetical protein
MGLAHGFTSPVALMVSIFKDIRIYAYPNAGGWYDFGFVLGISMLLDKSLRRVQSNALKNNEKENILKDTD